MPRRLRALVLSLLLSGTFVPAGVWPLDPEPSVVRTFEPPPNPYESGHRGVDLAGRPGQAVRSALAGTVGFVGAIGGKPVVTVLHGARRTTYEPVMASVERGQEVAAGEVLGRLIITSSHCFPAACLHWGLIHGDIYLDPLTLLDSGTARLLPLWREEPVDLRRAWTPPLSHWRDRWMLCPELRRGGGPAGMPDADDPW